MQIKQIWNRRISHKLLFLFILISLAIITLLGILEYLHIRNSDALMSALHGQFRNNVEHNLSIHEESSRLYLLDNTAWDELIQHIEHPSEQWFQDNLGIIISSYNFERIWVFSNQEKLIYTNGDSISQRLLPFPCVEDSVHLLFTDRFFIHFFQKSQGRFLEMFGSTVVPSKNALDRQSTPQGYLFVAKAFDTTFTRSLARSTDADVFLTTSSVPQNKLEPGDLYYPAILQDRNGETIGYLNFVKHQPGIRENLKSDRQSFIYVAVTLLLCMGLFWFFMNRWVNNPIGKLVRSLRKKDSGYIEKHTGSTDDIRALTQLVKANIELHKDLDAEIRERTLSEQQLQELNKTKDRVFSIIAHDLVNPFNTIIGFSTLILNSSASKHPQRVMDYTGMILETASETYRMLETLLAWGRMQTGAMVYKPQIQGLEEMISLAIGQVAGQAKLKKIKIEHAILPEVHVTADKNMIVTVIRNLLSNALKFTSAGGTITISTLREMDEIVTEISDTGIGMPPEKVESLFNPEKAESTHGTEHEKGTGLGLLLCYELVKRNKGEIHVSSKEGEGSRFSFSLPMA